MKKPCEICRGSGLVRLPIYRLATAMREVSETVALDEVSRSYPCPECAPTVPLERLALVEYHSLVDTRIDDPKFAAHARESTAHRLVAGMLKGGFIRFERGPDDDMHCHYPVRATVGVVSPKSVATLEQRIAERQAEVAQEVIAEAALAINNWGSYYGHNSLLKSQATDSLRDALKVVLARRANLIGARDR